MNIFYDTCALLDNYKKIFDNKDINIFISNITLNELEEIKTSSHKDEETKYNARQIIHWLNNNEKKYTIVPYFQGYENIIKKFDLPITNDSKIIACAYAMSIELNEFWFNTEDLVCKTLAKIVGLSTISYLTEENNEYNGYKEISLNDEELANFYNESFGKNINTYSLLENEYLIIKNANKNIIDKYKWINNEYIKVPFIKLESKFFGKTVAKDGDIYQQLALDSLNSNQITVLRGPAGSGKSYLAFAYMFSLLEHGKIDKIIVFCNTVATKGSAKLGFYPGSRTEKLLDSQIGNLLESKLGDRVAVERLIDDGQLILLPLSDIRGYDTTGMNAAVYITEAQNLDIEMMKLALQRIGEDSICILDGDSNAQVDLSMYAGNNNGLRRVTEVFKGQSFYGQVDLKNIHRSKIAAIADNL